MTLYSNDPEDVTSIVSGQVKTNSSWQLEIRCSVRSRGKGGIVVPCSVSFTRPTGEFVGNAEAVGDRERIINAQMRNRRTVLSTTVEEPSHQKVPTSVREHKPDEQWPKSRNGADEG